MPFVSSSVFISKVEAAREFKEELGEDFEGVLGYNPLLPSVEIKLNPVYANNDSLTVIEKSLLKNELVQEVSYQKSLVHMINENVRRISMILLIAGAALMLISFTLIRNTIHLSVYSQRFLIKTMQLVGAKPFFICKPFIQNSVWFGFFGSMVLIVQIVHVFIQISGNRHPGRNQRKQYTANHNKSNLSGQNLSLFVSLLFKIVFGSVSLGV